MRNIVYIILCICCNIKAQTNDTVPFVNINTKEVKCSHICKYKIINNSAEAYLTWLSAYPVSTFSKEMKIRCYFAQQHGDFNLFSLIYEELLKRNSLKVIGTNFIKRIPQGKSFTYKIKDYDDFKEQWIEHLVILKRKDVEEYIKFRFLDDWFYKGKNRCKSTKSIFEKRYKKIVIIDSRGNVVKKHAQLATGASGLILPNMKKKAEEHAIRDTKFRL